MPDLYSQCTPTHCPPHERRAQKEEEKVHRSADSPGRFSDLHSHPPLARRAKNKRGEQPRRLLEQFWLCCGRSGVLALLWMGTGLGGCDRMALFGCGVRRQTSRQSFATRSEGLAGGPPREPQLGVRRRGGCSTGRRACALYSEGVATVQRFTDHQRGVNVYAARPTG